MNRAMETVSFGVRAGIMMALAFLEILQQTLINLPDVADKRGSCIVVCTLAFRPIAITNSRRS